MATTRAQKNRAIRQESLREKLQGAQYLVHLHKIADELDDAEITATRANAIKARADIYFKLLNKLLPDVKAIEVSGEGGDPVVVRISNA